MKFTWIDHKIDLKATKSNNLNYLWGSFGHLQVILFQNNLHCDRSIGSKSESRHGVADNNINTHAHVCVE